MRLHERGIALRKALPSILKVAIPCVAVIFAIFVLLLWKNVFIFLDDNSTAINALNAIIAVFGFVSALALAYVRFFAGKLFARRVQLELVCSAECISDSISLHLIGVSIHNPGALSVYIDDICVNITQYDKKCIATTSNIRSFECITEHIKSPRDFRVDPGLTTTIPASIVVYNDTKVVVYEAVVRDTTGGVWVHSALVKNPQTPKA